MPIQREDSQESDAERETLPIFAVHSGILTANGDLYWELLGEFEQACNKLLQSRQQQLTLDLTPVNFISSSFLGCLSNLVLKASRTKKRITFRVTLDVSWLFDIMGIRKNMVMEIV